MYFIHWTTASLPWLLTPMAPPIQIILQARVNSTRLPGKALMPVGGIPSAVLAALRAARDGLPVLVATSTSPSNDPLVAALQGVRLPVMRGSEEDVLGRYVIASQSLPDEAILVRLTGDNVFPDSDLVSKLVETLLAKDAEIVGTSSAKGLPYGLSAEAFRVAALRRAAACTDTTYDREHVTPWLYRNARSAVFDSLDDQPNRSCLRCTLDTPDDYQTLTRVFDGVRDPIAIGWKDLVQKLASLPESPRICVPRNSRGGSRLVLGTAQLGAPYGSVRKTVPPTEAETVALVRTAIRHGVTHIDTARGYPGSEDRLGMALANGWTSRVQVMTKLSLLEGLPADASEIAVQKAVDESISTSRQKLGLPALPVVLLHRAAHLHAWAGAAWRRLLQLQRNGDIGVLGVSVQSVEEARTALNVNGIGHIQLACNILDTRWTEAGIPALLDSRRDVVVHARGALLQGVLLANDAEAWPRINGLNAGALSGWLAQMARRYSHGNVAGLCYAWLRAQAWIDAVVVGMETESQVIENAALFTGPVLDEAAISEIEKSRPAVPPALLNPAAWPRAFP